MTDRTIKLLNGPPENDLDALWVLAAEWPAENQMHRQRLADLNDAVPSEEKGPRGSIHWAEDLSGPRHEWLQIMTGGILELEAEIRELKETAFWRRRFRVDWGIGTFLFVV